MKIDKHLQTKLSAIYQNQQQVKRNQVAARKADADRVEISRTAKELQRLVEKAKNLPDVRAEKVAELKKRIENGTYQVPVEKLADKMLREMKQGD
ncbi:MAG: flagellar biosynthesis anti-sigma factor FlgM [Thermoanaerobacteraceae bacterium]|nr:flagellar biosynthesis anti-sigma factor FlgM [Thermoanaerobacteraceae bacterium]